MKTVIIGSGCVGLSLAMALINKLKIDPKEILVIDRYNIPSKGTSIRNSGVLHAGLYYEAGTLKADLCRSGSESLKKWCLNKSLPLLQCGKLLVPFTKTDYSRLDKIYLNAKNNGCTVEFVNYQKANEIQPGIIKAEKYLWSPKTAVFSPLSIIESFYFYLKDSGVQFIKSNIIDIDNDKKFIQLEDSKIYYERFLNCAGSGALGIANKVTSKFKDLDILPILGEYGIQKKGLEIKTNIYPVPNPELPFLGIHLTPKIDGKTLIGPNAVPAIKKDIQKLEIGDLLKTPINLLKHAELFISNNQNYREHALSEICISAKRKFLDRSKRYLDAKFHQEFDLDMTSMTYGIRPQLINKRDSNFVNDFLYKKIDGNIHVVNAVSPAFTSCLALSEYLVSLI